MIDGFGLGEGPHFFIVVLICLSLQKTHLRWAEDYPHLISFQTFLSRRICFTKSSLLLPFPNTTVISSFLFTLRVLPSSFTFFDGLFLLARKERLVEVFREAVSVYYLGYESKIILLEKSLFAWFFFLKLRGDSSGLPGIILLLIRILDSGGWHWDRDFVVVWSRVLAISSLILWRMLEPLIL